MNWEYNGMILRHCHDFPAIIDRRYRFRFELDAAADPRTGERGYMHEPGPEAKSMYHPYVAWHLNHYKTSDEARWKFITGTAFITEAETAWRTWLHEACKRVAKIHNHTVYGDLFPTQPEFFTLAYLLDVYYSLMEGCQWNYGAFISPAVILELVRINMSPPLDRRNAHAALAARACWPHLVRVGLRVEW